MKVNLKNAIHFNNKGDKLQALKFAKAHKQLAEQRKELIENYPELVSETVSSKPTKVKKTLRKETVTMAISEIENVAMFNVEAIETEIHNLEKMEAVSVIDAEIQLLEAKASEANKAHAAFYKQKKEHLEFHRNMLVKNIESGLLLQENYIKNIQQELVYEKGIVELLIANKAKDDDIKRVKTRISLIERELRESEESPKENLITTILEVKSKRESGEVSTLNVEVKPTEKEIIDSLIISEEDKDLPIECKKQYDVILERFKEYKAAIEYFLENERIKDAVRLLDTAKYLKCCLELTKREKIVNDIDKPLTPEIMFGQTTENRNKELQELIKCLSEQLTGEKKMKERKKTRRRKSGQTRLNKTEGIIEKLKEIVGNPWQPLPLYKEEEITQKDIGENEVAVEYEPNSTIAETEGWMMNYSISTGKEMRRGSFDPHEKGQVKVTFTKSINEIDKGEAIFKLVKDSSIAYKDLKVSLDQFAEVAIIRTEYDTSTNFKLDISIRIHRPINNKEAPNSEGKRIIVRCIYPAFRSNKVEIVDKPVTDTKANSMEENKEILTEFGRTLEDCVKDMPLPSPLPNLPKELKERDIRDPDNHGNLVCSSYLKKRLAVYTALVNKMLDKRKRIPTEIGDKLKLISWNDAVLESQINSGKLSAETYKGLLKTQLKKDLMLIEYLKALNQHNRASIVKERISCVQNELASF